VPDCRGWCMVCLQPHVVAKHVNSFFLGRVCCVCCGQPASFICDACLKVENQKMIYLRQQLTWRRKKLRRDGTMEDFWMLVINKDSFNHGITFGRPTMPKMFSFSWTKWTSTKAYA
jgi:hypothetical protein